jgi:hypothetical protein
MNMSDETVHNLLCMCVIRIATLEACVEVDNRASSHVSVALTRLGIIYNVLLGLEPSGGYFTSKHVDLVMGVSEGNIYLRREMPSGYLSPPVLVVRPVGQVERVHNAKITSVSPTHLDVVVDGERRTILNPRCRSISKQFMERFCDINKEETSLQELLQLFHARVVANFSGLLRNPDRDMWWKCANKDICNWYKYSLVYMRRPNRFEPRAYCTCAICRDPFLSVCSQCSALIPRSHMAIRQKNKCYCFHCVYGERAGPIIHEKKSGFQKIYFLGRYR